MGEGFFFYFFIFCGGGERLTRVLRGELETGGEGKMEELHDKREGGV